METVAWLAIGIEWKHSLVGGLLIAEAEHWYVLVLIEALECTTDDRDHLLIGIEFSIGILELQVAEPIALILDCLMLLLLLLLLLLCSGQTS
jgi:hypothetical protein